MKGFLHDRRGNGKDEDLEGCVHCGLRDIAGGPIRKTILLTHPPGCVPRSKKSITLLSFAGRLKNCNDALHMRHTLDLASYGRCLRFYSVSYVPHQIDRHGQAALDSPSWETDHAKRVGRRTVDSKRVNVDNLSETLEAHRAHNRASIIRKIKLPHEPYYQVYRPLFQSSRNSDEGRVKNGKLESRQEESESGIRLESSADREPNDPPTGHKNKKTESSKTLEYVGKALDPIGTWRLHTEPESESESVLQRPWLAYLKDSSGDRFLRFVSL